LLRLEPTHGGRRLCFLRVVELSSDDSIDGVFVICFAREKYVEGISVDVGFLSRVDSSKALVFYEDRAVSWRYRNECEGAL
jgi:hypothetical protein